MRNPSLRLLAVTLLSMLAFLATTLPAGAQTRSTMEVQKIAARESASARVECGHLQVYLHGWQQPGVKCLDVLVQSRLAHLSTSRSIVPEIYTTGCDNNSLVIWADANFTGWTICFKGAGATDMTSYCGPAPVGCLWNWNDQASSYAPGCSAGTFYMNIGEGGEAQGFASHGPRHNFGGPGMLPNDSLSSVKLTSNCV